MAQPQGGPPSAKERAKIEAAKLKTELSLTDDQQQQIYNILAEESDSERPTRDATEADRTAFMKKMEAKRQEQETKIKAVLTDDQKTKYTAYLAKRQKEMGQRKGHRPSDK